MGQKIETYDSEGNIVHVQDDRVLSEEKERKIAILKIRTSELILEQAPQHKQINASLGLYSETETQKITEIIATLREKCNAVEKLIEDSESLDDLDNINLRID